MPLVEASIGASMQRCGLGERNSGGSKVKFWVLSEVRCFSVGQKSDPSEEERACDAQKRNFVRAGGGGETTARRNEGRRQSTHEGGVAAFASSFFAVIASFRSKSSH